MKASPALLLIAVVAFIAPDFLLAESKELRRPTTVVSHIRRESVDSTAIATIGYSKKLRALEIEFVNGAIYRYSEVPNSLYRELTKANSKARFYDKNIRGRYRSVHVRPRKKK
jgi:KTSC domain-containing protein